jgi:hypothetical protein
MHDAKRTADAVHAAASGAALIQVIAPDLRHGYKAAGKVYRARSPLVGEHGDVTPSFYVSVSEGWWKCWSTGAGGNWYRYLQSRFPGKPHAELVAIAADRLNEPLDLTAAAARVEPVLRTRERYYAAAAMTDPKRNGRGPFEDYLVRTYGDHGRATLAAYGVGTSADGVSNFWHVDVNGNVHGCKRMQFELNADGKPSKKDAKGRARVTWEWPAKESSVWTPVFGEHLLRHSEPSLVFICEAEDTALHLYASCLAEGVSAVCVAAGGRGGYVNAFRRLDAARGHMKWHGVDSFRIAPDRDHTNADLDALELAAFRHCGVQLERWTVDQLARDAEYRGTLGSKWDAGDLVHAIVTANRK